MLLAAALTAFLLGLAHSLLGEVLLLRHLSQVKGLPTIFGSDEFAKRTLRWAWHLTTILGWAFALMLAKMSTAPIDPFYLRTIAASALACALLILVWSRAKHPGWIGFLVVAVLAWLA